jgi:hydrogenase expression/formation protein HypE
MLKVCPDIHCMRDATRGGIATVLNEFALSSHVCIRLKETAIPIRDEVRGMCEILGLDPLYLANEGKVVAIIPAHAADKVIEVMRAHPDGRHSSIIAEVTEKPAARVILSTLFGGERVVDMLVGEQLPRIC